MKLLKKILTALTPSETPYILIVSDEGSFKKIRAHFHNGVYWVMRDNKMYPLRKARMCRTAYNLVEENPYAYQGTVIEKSWCPLTPQMLAWYDMLPEIKQHSGDTASSPQA